MRDGFLDGIKSGRGEPGISTTVQIVREAIAIITRGKPFNVEAMEGLPIWRTNAERSAVPAVISIYGIDLKNGMAIMPSNRADAPADARERHGTA
ncbi:hypothetical protein E4191_07685 [Paracoccus liaowanqingii]|uniref:Uncharacterized protein n=1 Tax=Paracoccus liaowanqingii TaxID=2560053 RepID=A0A4P7HKG7_9RHOB|nr:hypothetical protein [Paracoccus liaowanqingii]QBX34605.1 hypothetical protein E4191_07685 [Paracoccus liaowanqingii]